MKFFQIKDDVVWREKEGVCVVLNSASGDYYTLNETGAILWKGLIDQARSLDDVSSDISALEGAPDVAIVQQDAETMIAEWVQEGLVTPIA